MKIWSLVTVGKSVGVGWNKEEKITKITSTIDIPKIHDKSFWEEEFEFRENCEQQKEELFTVEPKFWCEAKGSKKIEELFFKKVSKPNESVLVRRFGG